jgi:hypothetical protein
MSDGFFGKDKEYGDVDHDGDIDILYLTNTNELWTILNTGSVTVPDYRAAARVFTGLTGVFSFRLLDWYDDGVNDLVVMADILGVMTISLYLDISAQIGAPVSDATLFDESQFPINNAQLMEIGDIDGDHFPDVLISGQGFPINGTAYFKSVGAGWTFPLAYEFVAPQTYENPLIPEVGLSFPCPELFDADCDGDLDLFISDPTWTFQGGGHMDYFENTGPGSPFQYFTQVTPCPFGFDDIPLPNMDLSCDWVVTRMVDFFGDGFPEAIAYNPCHPNTPKGDMFYYRNVLEMDTTTAVSNILRDDSFLLYPNPATDELTVKWGDADADNFTCTIVDCFGRIQQVYPGAQNAGRLNIDIHLLSQGTYFLKLLSDTGLVKVLKFVKM